MGCRLDAIIRAGLTALTIGLAGLSSPPAEAAADAASLPGLAATAPSPLVTLDRSQSGGSALPLKLLASNDPPPIVAGNPVTAPLKWTGVWYWTREDGHESLCTAQFITQRVLLLAAHCIRNRETGQFYTTNDRNSGFLLQYQNGDYSKEYHAVCKATWNGWAVPLRAGEDPSKPDTMTEQRRKEYETALLHSWQWDYGFILLDGESITGHYNYRVNERWNGAVSTGYPGQIMGGKVVQTLRGDVFAEQDVSFSQGDEQNEQVIWHGNPDHTQGASGGAWVVHFDSAVSPDTNLIVGLNSYGNPSKPGANFGPFFTEKFQTLLDFTTNGCK